MVQSTLILSILALSVLFQSTSVTAWTTAEVCKWVGDHSGYYCDGKAERWIWRKWHDVVNGAKDCNSFCIHLKHKSGQCVRASNYDTSSWCGQGQACICKD